MAAKNDEPFLVRVMKVVRPKLLPGLTSYTFPLRSSAPIRLVIPAC